MRVKLTDYLADGIIVIRCDGCASLIGFKGFVGSMMKLVKVNGDDEESEIDAIIRMIRKEARGVKKSSNLFYDLSNFTHRNTVGQTSATLLSFVSAHIQQPDIKAVTQAFAVDSESHNRVPQSGHFGSSCQDPSQLRKLRVDQKTFAPRLCIVIRRSSSVS